MQSFAIFHIFLLVFLISQDLITHLSRNQQNISLFPFVASLEGEECLIGANGNSEQCKKINFDGDNSVVDDDDSLDGDFDDDYDFLDGDFDDDDCKKDNHESCELWAKSGECENNPNYMHANCKLSCKICDPDQTEKEG